MGLRTVKGARGAENLPFQVERLRARAVGCIVGVKRVGGQAQVTKFLSLFTARGERYIAAAAVMSGARRGMMLAERMTWNYYHQTRSRVFFCHFFPSILPQLHLFPYSTKIHNKTIKMAMPGGMPMVVMSKSIGLYKAAAYCSQTPAQSASRGEKLKPPTLSLPRYVTCVIQLQRC